MTRPQLLPSLSLIRRYFDALERDAPEEEIASFFAPGVVQREFPNRLIEAGAERGLEQILEGSRKGRSVVRDQRYVITSVICEGQQVALELDWSAELKLPLGRLPAGARLRARCGVFFRLEDERIAQQHNYDCFDAF